MNKLKRSKFFSLGRKWVFTLALFLLVFTAASVVKVQALGNVTGYLWGGSEETSDGTINGNESGVGWISMSGANYGVTIPTDNTAVTGYAWANASNTPNSSVSQEGNGLGWIQFDPAPDDVRYPGCGYPALPCNGVMRNDDNLEGWARFVSIRDALAANNSGGWEGWIKMRGSNYGVQISKMLGVGSGSHTYAWSNELGVIDFGQAKAPCMPLPGGCGSALSGSYCLDDPAPSTNLCNSASELQGSAPSGSAPWNWQCVSNTCPGTGSLIASCGPVNYATPETGKCGTDNGVNFCGKSVLPSNLCDSGTASPVTTGYSEYTWSCGKTTCGGTVVECSAPGNHCGWIETNP